LNAAEAVSITYTWKVDVTEPQPSIELVDLVFACDVPVVIPEVEFTDNCDEGVIAHVVKIDGEVVEDLSMYVFPEGDTEVCYTATDECGNTYEKCITVTVEPCVIYCETAFAMGENATCFSPEYFSKWGWTNKISAGEYTWPMYAGAADCDINKGTLTGYVTVKYIGGYVTVEYNMLPGFKLDATHVYAGKDMFQKVPRGKTGWVYTDAPGQFKNVGPFTGDIYVIVHAVVCSKYFQPDMPKSAQIITPDFEANSLKVYPNPFSEKLNFEFVSDKTARAVIEIFNMTGQSVTRLLDQQVQKGVMNRVEYEPTNIISGVYLYKLTIDGNTSVGRVIYRK
jgi:hypothetical protein